MRLSILPDDPGYNADVRHIVVLLNGDKLVRDVIIADEEEAFIVIPAYDQAGRPLLTPDGTPCIERIEGIVQIQGLPRRIRDGQL